ncbi:unnamed protein product [Dovyalis caffra]|uniref:Uncharacterized protein n=1 Tax=Dovyalis caffra TaxID=77055 RepID=A0AAV1RGK4_9ROSI|nr:unnamed protein product [Dovyalis caffra]
MAIIGSIECLKTNIRKARKELRECGQSEVGNKECRVREGRPGQLAKQDGLRDGLS